MRWDRLSNCLKQSLRINRKSKRRGGKNVSESSKHERIETCFSTISSYCTFAIYFITDETSSEVQTTSFNAPQNKKWWLFADFNDSPELSSKGIFTRGFSLKLFRLNDNFLNAKWHWSVVVVQWSHTQQKKKEKYENTRLLSFDEWLELMDEMSNDNQATAIKTRENKTKNVAHWESLNFRWKSKSGRQHDNNIRAQLRSIMISLGNEYRHFSNYFIEYNKMSTLFYNIILRQRQIHSSDKEKSI